MNDDPNAWADELFPVVPGRNRAERRARVAMARRRERMVKAPPAPERKLVRRKRSADMLADLLDGDRSTAMAYLTHTVGVERVPDALAWIEKHRSKR